MLKIYKDIVQGDEAWFKVRTGILTASEIKYILTPTLKIANNDKERSHLYELVAQRVTGYVEPSYINDDMLRGQEDEVEAKILYSEKYLPVEEVGFMTNDKWGFTLGYSPDGLVSETGLIEIKSRRQKFQVERFLANSIDPEHILQVQTGLLVSERNWCDYISYCGGMPMFVTRVFPDDKIQAAILEAASSFEAKIVAKIAEYNEKIKGFYPTKRRVEQEIVI